MAAAYYIDRARVLASCAQTLQARQISCLFIESQEIVEQPSAVLGALDDFLGLESPLREDYSLFPRSGQAGLGDSSRTLQSGKIVRQDAPATSRAWDTPWSDECWQVYHESRRVLEQSCLTVSRRLAMPAEPFARKSLGLS